MSRDVAAILLAVALGAVIRIEEAESQQECRCLCLRDLDYAVNVPPGEYRLIVTGLYLAEGDEPLDFMLDLSEAASETLCVARDHYPWDPGAGRDGSSTGLGPDSSGSNSKESPSGTRSG